jgi:HSP20 family protein
MIQAGFSISFGLDKLADLSDTPTGKPKSPMQVPVQETREPYIDVFAEAGFILILAELPGITRKDVELSLTDDLLTISAARDQRRYYQEILLPGPHPCNRLEFSCNNDILEIRAFR